MDMLFEEVTDYMVESMGLHASAVEAVVCQSDKHKYSEFLF
jgi:hypothetical protein